MLASHCVIDGFLGGTASADLLNLATQNEARFVPAKVFGQADGQIDLKSRQTFLLNAQWEEQKTVFLDAIRRRLDQIFAETGVASFKPDFYQIELAANRDGGHFRRHIDTYSGGVTGDTHRVISMVYYMHREPRAFSGGEFILHAMIGDDRDVIEPRHDRLVAFPSIAPHEVNRTQVPGDRFADARFSINCWLRRKRG